MPVAVQEGLQGASNGERVPVALVNLQHLLHHQRAVQTRDPFLSREEDLSRETRGPVRVLGGTGIDPQGGLQDLNALATLLQKLEGEAEARLTADVSLVCGYMSRRGAQIRTCCINARHVQHIDFLKRCLESQGRKVTGKRLCPLSQAPLTVTTFVRKEEFGDRCA